MRIPSQSLVIIAITLGISSCKENDPLPTLNWEKLPTFPAEGRADGVAFWIEDKFYTGLGNGYSAGTWQDYKDFWEFDAEAKTWTRLADFPDTRSLTFNFSVGGKGYVGFGIKPNVGDRKDMWEFDPSNNTWTMIGTYEDVHSSLGSPLTGANVVDGKVYGWMIGSAPNFWVFDPSSKSLTKVLQENYSYRAWSTFVLDKQIFIGAGLHSLNVLDPATGLLSVKSSFPGDNFVTTLAFAFEGKGYILGGYVDSKTIKKTWQYDASADTWTRFNDFPGTTLHNSMSAYSSTRVCVGGGWLDTPHTTSKEYWMLETGL
jgi:N-acetylneuraminic acid mutarotase